MKVGDIKDLATLGLIGIGIYFIYKFTKSPIEAARQYPPVAMTSGIVSGAALIDNLLKELGGWVSSLPQAPSREATAPWAGFTGQE